MKKALSIIAVLSIFPSCMATIAVDRKANYGESKKPGYKLLYPPAALLDVATFPFQYVWLMFNHDKSPHLFN